MHSTRSWVSFAAVALAAVVGCGSDDSSSTGDDDSGASAPSDASVGSKDGGAPKADAASGGEASAPHADGGSDAASPVGPDASSASDAGDAAAPADAGDAAAPGDAGDAAAPGDAGDAAAPPFDSGPGVDAGDASTVGVLDPTKDGPYTITEIDATTMVAATSTTIPIHCAYPTKGPQAGPYPVVVLAHGFSLPASQYYGYVRRLATFGYVALTADYQAGLTDSNNVDDAHEVMGGIDWALGAAALTGKVDATRIATMGHSRGGKAAVLAASYDPRVVAVLGLDPVDAKPPVGNCDPVTQCPDARAALHGLSIPSLLLGETTDSAAGGGGQACAPAAGNFQTFYAQANSPSAQVTVAGANHMSFLDDPSTCGLTCAFCNAATANHADVISLAYALPVAFFERRLRGNAGYDAWIIGAEAQSHWVKTGLAAIESK